VIKFKGKRDKWGLSTIAAERLDFKKLGSAASIKIDSENANVRQHNAR